MIKTKRLCCPKAFYLWIMINVHLLHCLLSQPFTLSVPFVYPKCLSQLHRNIPWFCYSEICFKLLLGNSYLYDQGNVTFSTRLLFVSLFIHFHLFVCFRNSVICFINPEDNQTVNSTQKTHSSCCLNLVFFTVSLWSWLVNSMLKDNGNMNY